MTEEQPGFAERDDDEFSEQTGGGAGWEDAEDDEVAELGEDDPDSAPGEGGDWDDPDND